MKTSFFALISRMRHIGRWGLMRNSAPENVQEHSHMVAVLAHALAVIRRDVYGKNADPNQCAAAALYHDASEIYTGDLPTPVKYHSPEIMQAYKQVEHTASDKLLRLLPDALRPAYIPLLRDLPGDVKELVKAADKLSAYIKCMEELAAGNNEFSQAARQTRAALEASPLPEVQYFMENCMPAFSLTLDELDLTVN